MAQPQPASGPNPTAAGAAASVGQLLAAGNDPSTINDGAGQEEPTQPANRLERILMDNNSARIFVYRAVVVSQLLPNSPTVSPQVISSHYQSLFKSLQSDTKAVSGVLVVLPSVALHLVEGPRDVIMAYLRDLDDTCHQNTGANTRKAPTNSGTVVPADGQDSSSLLGKPDPIFSASRLISVQDDVQRVFPFWVSRVIDPSKAAANASTARGGAATAAIDPITLAATEIAAAELQQQQQQQQLQQQQQMQQQRSVSTPGGVIKSPDDLVDLSTITSASRVSRGLIQLGTRLASVSKSDLKSFLDQVLTSGMLGNATGESYIPPVGVLLNLVADSGLPTARDWLAVFDPEGANPLALEYVTAMDDQQVWPMPRWAYLGGIKAVTSALESKNAPPSSGTVVGGGAGQGGLPQSASNAALNEASGAAAAKAAV
ncbi:hypothetical protein BCR44DRAFT_1423211 [Catenaria anguillulae PL171]|uniref:Uncharacterized protein n=1 Tax=Catenaria anguillulae PL171 TaxID=765915 RepID=A0A1Y2I442_9FUNG|nr:hypothetical protein BCR44DRAFT_1423211 [Catenaria anguillulae PL171]